MALINLKKEMAGADVSIEAVAAEIGVHRNTASNKIDGITKITFEEAVKIRNKFFPKLGLEYLFKDVNG
ncbi:MAG: XRE family transcriptional regulator [Alphaproteobacteria bacterium]|nr:XRE family transcriptional regulator [Alphaproteobacteria bacterium]